MKRNILFFLVHFFVVLFAQQDTILLKDLVVTDTRILQNKTQFSQILNDSILEKNQSLLTDVLKFNSPIYFKENGHGMVSSPVFRGTTAQQTALVWNGIDINSGFLGQSDFNTISSRNYEQIKIKSGGGSVIYGSGAIGGSIHLLNELKFNQGASSTTSASYGSFGTFDFLGKLENSADKFSYQLSLNHLSSENDYNVKKLDYKNINGKFRNNTANGNFAFQLNTANTLSFFLQVHDDERYFSLTEPTQTKTKYENRNFRGLAQWENTFKRLKSYTRLAFLQERFRYFEDIDDNYTTQGKLNTMIAKYDGIYRLNNEINVSLLSEYRYSIANGEHTGIEDVKQHSANIAFMFSHQIHPKIYYETGIRNEFNNKFKSPLLYSAGINLQPFQFHVLKFNISKNFRAPTFNDLYWQPGGNLNLKAENSLQFEIGNTFTYKKNHFSIQVFKNKIKDMIRWIPTQQGFWSPENLDNVDAKGVEAFLNLHKKIKNHQIQFSGSYAYTISENTQTSKQLPYVPQHKTNGTFTHNWQKWTWFVQGMFVGETYTQTDNLQSVDAYTLFNFGTNYTHNKHWSAGFRLNNFTNVAYEVTRFRPMPPTNFQIHFKYNIL